MVLVRGELIVCNLLVIQSLVKLWTDGLALCDKIDPVHITQPMQDDGFCQLAPLMPVPVACAVTVRCSALSRRKLMLGIAVELLQRI